MKASLSFCLVLAFLLGVSTVPLMGQGSAEKAGGATYVGVATCKMCHKGEAKGKQFEIWEGSAHAGAYTALASEKAKEAGAKLGIDDPQKSDKCLKCHTTAFGVDAAMLGPKFVKEEGVQCEACHGPGSNYKSMSIMKDKSLAIKNGLILPDEKVCVTCHNDQSPTFKGFDYATYFAKIAHPIPKK
jgi:hypothetical protein